MGTRSRERGYTFDDGKAKSLGEIGEQIKIWEIKKNMPRSETIKASGLSKSAFYDCLKHPEKWRLGVLYDVYHKLQVPQEERRFL